MAKKRYTIFCDESAKKGEKFANFYGGALVKSSDVEAISEVLNAKKSELNLNSELKWVRITKNYETKYIEFITLFFEFIATGRIKVRLMFTSNRVRPSDLTDYHKEYRYFLLYYQFIKHAFGLNHSNPNALDKVFVELLMDEIPDTKEKVKEFRSFISAISQTAPYYGRRVFIPRHSIAEVDSKNHVILQGLDIILGSMQFRLNNFHLLKPDGAARRGKRTIAKEKVYKEINSQIRQIYPNFNIGITTGYRDFPTDRWNDPYRHWVLKPNNGVRE